MPAQVQIQARALGDPTRYAVFCYLADAAKSVGVAELTDHFGLNHNAIRQHLARLVDAGLVDESTVPSTGRGRPRLTYTVAPNAGSRWGALAPYERLSVLLAEAVRTGATPVEVGRRAVAAADIASASALDADPVEMVAEFMASNGFEPDVCRRTTGEVDVMLRACPFEAAAVADPEVICAVHLGMAQGIADLTDGRVIVDELVPGDPRPSACRLSLHVVAGGV
jgi:predicted ArsR family transcriptional regulator